MKINSFNSSLLLQLNKTNKQLSKTFQQLSSGKRINEASDDPAGLAVATSLNASRRGLNTINQGISYAQGALQTASGGLNQTLESLQRARDLALQAANGTLNDSDRANLQKEYDQVLQNVDQISSQTSFNGTPLLDGTYNTNVQTSEGGSPTNLQINSTSSNALGIASSGISTQSAAEDALEDIDAAIQQVSSEIASVGAYENALDYSADANSIQAENLAAAESEIIDVNYAEALSKLKQQQVQAEAQIVSLRQEGKNRESFVKKLIGKG
jgi:flagellin